MTAPAGKCLRRMSSLMTPFCSESTAVCGPTIGRPPRCRVGVPELHRDDHTSAVPMVAGSSVAFTFATWMSPCASFSIVSPLLAHRFQVRAAGDEVHVVACVREPPAEETADAARAHHRNFHSLSFPASTSATCSTCVSVSPLRRRRPSMFSIQPRSPSTIASAPVASAFSHLLSAMRVETSPNLTAKVPPNPQQASGLAHLD